MLIDIHNPTGVILFSLYYVIMGSTFYLITCFKPYTLHVNYVSTGVFQYAISNGFNIANVEYEYDYVILAQIIITLVGERQV